MSHDYCLRIKQALSQSLIYAVDANIVVKVSFQFLIANQPDFEAELRRDDSLRSLELLQKEINIY